MDWLRNWDDLVHGTAVFSAAVPFLAAGLLAWKLLAGLWWLAAAAALMGPYLWLFGVPEFPPGSSEDAAVMGLAAASGAIALESVLRLKWAPRLILRILLWTVLVWSLYPGWLASDGGLPRRLGVAGGLALLTAAWAALIEHLTQRDRAGEEARRNRLTMAALIPPAAALAVLLQLGGAMRFGQSAGALAAALGAVTVVWLWRKREGDGIQRLGALWAMLFAQLAWCGWLFAEIRYGLAALLCGAPLAGLLTRWLPLPRGTAFREALWDGLASALAAAITAGIALAAYQAAASGYEGY